TNGYTRPGSQERCQQPNTYTRPGSSGGYQQTNEYQQLPQQQQIPQQQQRGYVFNGQHYQYSPRGCRGRTSATAVPERRVRRVSAPAADVRTAGSGSPSVRQPGVLPAGILRRAGWDCPEAVVL
ncbi:hypothetical protein LTS00_018147, partial [Friedmanniomyces endolithicus]